MKFKAGDKIKIIGGGKYAGKEGVLFDCTGTYDWLVSLDNRTKWPAYENELELVPEVPELVGVKMLISDDEKTWAKRIVIGKMDGQFLALAHSTNNFFRWTHAKPLPEKVEVVIAGVKGHLSRESAEELKRMFKEEE